MLVANASFVFKDAGSIQKEEKEVENIWHRMIRCAVCYYACGDGVRGEGEKGVGSIPAIRCNAGKVNKEVGCEIRCVGEAVLMNLR